MILGILTIKNIREIIDQTQNYSTTNGRGYKHKKFSVGYKNGLLFNVIINNYWETKLIWFA